MFPIPIHIPIHGSSVSSLVPNRNIELDSEHASHVMNKMAAPEWTPRVRNYEAEHRQLSLVAEQTLIHPLKSAVVSEGTVKKVSKNASQSSVKSDPLSVASSSFDGTDPLTMIASDPLTRMVQDLDLNAKIVREEVLDESFEPWSSKRQTILAKYTTSEKLSITTSFLSSGSDKERVVVKATTTGTVTDKVKNRLEQLDDFEEGSVREMLNLSQQEYVTRIEELNNALTQAWEQDQRVKSLKIAIQCAKVLAETSVVQFYPSKYVLITDILDTFGKLVYERILSKSSFSTKDDYSANFSPDQVPASAKETCRNWFFKIASIRELVPRFYAEAAILRCYRFLDNSEIAAALTRLAAMCKGIGDPLVAVYARCFLCKVGLEVSPNYRDYLMIMFNEFLHTYPQIQTDTVQNILAVQKVEMPQYLTLYSPALDWILQCIAYKSSERTLMDVLQKCREQCNCALLVNSIMSAFKPQYIAVRATQFTTMIRDCEETGFPKYLLHKTLGTCLVMAAPPDDQRLQVLNDVWKIVTKLKKPSDYMSCAEVWIEFVCIHFGKREINTILGDIIKHMTPDRAFEDHYAQLQSVISKVLAHIPDFSILFALDKFMAFIDLFQKDYVRVDVCKNIMDMFIKNQLDATSDPVIMNAIMFICKVMHDSVNALTLDDDRRMISRYIIGFISRISFERDFEQQLSFYVDCRASFSHLDAVLTHLVQSVNRLAMSTRAIVKGNHTRKTAAFVRACAAYSFITIPSLKGSLVQLNLYLQSGQVALINHCLSQADGFFKAAISLIPDIPKTVEIDGKKRFAEPLLLEYMSNFCSTLVGVQDAPDQGVLYLARGLLNMIQTYTWDVNADTKALIYMNVLVLMSAMSQETFIYHVDKVEANDTFYGSDPKFLNEVRKICSTLLSQITGHITALTGIENGRRKSDLIVELISRLVCHSQLDETSVEFVSGLWKQALETKQADTKLMDRLRDYIRQMAARADGKEYALLLSRISR